MNRPRDLVHLHRAAELDASRRDRRTPTQRRERAVVAEHHEYEVEPRLELEHGVEDDVEPALHGRVAAVDEHDRSGSTGEGSSSS